MLFYLKKNQTMIASMVLWAGLCSSSVVLAESLSESLPESLAEKLLLKPSMHISPVKSSKAVNELAVFQHKSVLGNLELFRGVVVNTDLAIQARVENQRKSEKRKTDAADSLVKAVYGGLQISLKENLSLVYSPGRLSRQAFNTEGRGLYLVTDRGGHANWFVGVESSAAGKSSEAQRSTNTTQFGVIVSLD